MRSFLRGSGELLEPKRQKFGGWVSSWGSSLANHVVFFVSNALAHRELTMPLRERFPGRGCKMCSVMVNGLSREP